MDDTSDEYGNTLDDDLSDDKDDSAGYERGRTSKGGSAKRRRDTGEDRDDQDRW